MLSWDTNKLKNAQSRSKIYFKSTNDRTALQYYQEMTNRSNKQPLTKK